MSQTTERIHELVEKLNRYRHEYYTHQFGFIQGEQWDAVPYLFQAADSLIAHRLGG